VRVQTAVVTFGCSLFFLTASAAGNVGEATLRVVSPSSTEQVALNDRRDLTALPGAAAALLLNDRTTIVGRARDESAALSASTPPGVANERSSEPHPAMMLLSVVALIGYVIGRRGVQRA
jgi:hypothetical protein